MNRSNSGYGARMVRSFASLVIWSGFLSLTFVCEQCLGQPLANSSEVSAVENPNENHDALEAFSRDIVVLRSDARLEGKVTVQESDGAKFYLVELEDGTKIKLDSKAVARVISPPDSYSEYVKLAPTLSDTVDSHWQMQAWCKENRLTKQREYHLRRVVELDPEFVQARSLLGFKNDYATYEGTWLQKDHYYLSNGYVKHQNKWRLPQGVKFVTQRDANRRALGEWKVKLGQMRRKYLKNDITGNEFLKIQDPAAIGAVIEAYDDEKKNINFKRLLIDVLGGFDNNLAHRKLIQIYLNDENLTNYERALTMLKQDHFDKLVSSRAMYPFMNPSPGTPRYQVLRAGFLIGEFNDRTAIRELIDGIVTEHMVDNPYFKSGNMNVQQGNQGTGMTQGDDQPKRLLIKFDNDTVLHALERITGVHHGYSKDRWLNWYIGTQTLENVNLRRDD